MQCGADYTIGIFILRVWTNEDHTHKLEMSGKASKCSMFI